MIWSVVVFLYFGILACLMVVGLHRYYLVYLFLKNRHRKAQPHALPDDLPTVTVQLPVFNEQYVVDRLIQAACRIDYPMDKLHIQVLDDSTDETTGIGRRVVEKMAAKGFCIDLIHREDRTGFKAGALAEGLDCAAGELVAVFDADFLPSPTFLKETVGFFSDPKVGMVQVRWGYINEDYSLLTLLQSMFLDGHFVVEHAARNWSDRFFNFNGTAGIWRKKAIMDAGGWQHDTLTEDLDLSYRAQIKGWRFVYLVDSVCDSEIPVEMNAFKTQQHRWAKGSIETGRKILPKMVSCNLPLKVKTEAFFHMGGNVAYFLLLILSLLTFPALVGRIHMGWRTLAAMDLVVFLLAFFPVALFYVFAQKIAGKNWLRRTMLVPFLMSLGIGMSANNAKAVWEGLTGKKSAFVRTPKYRIEKKGQDWWGKRYRNPRPKGVIFELFMTIYCFQAVIYAFYYEVYLSIPFLMLFVFGFGYVSALSVYQTYFKLDIAAELPATHQTK